MNIREKYIIDKQSQGRFARRPQYAPENGSINSFSTGCDIVQPGDPECNHMVTNVYPGPHTGNMSGVIPLNRYGTSTPVAMA
jgi:hypothetical protein